MEHEGLRFGGPKGGRWKGESKVYWDKRKLVVEGIEMHGVEEGCQRKYQGQGHRKEGHKGKGQEHEEWWRGGEG